MQRLLQRIWPLALLASVASGPALAQVEPPDPSVPVGTEELSEPEAAVPAQPTAPVEIQPRARDDEIRARLDKILRATGWFTGTEVRVQDGVVFLEGRAQTQDYKKWAGELARSTRDVAVVVNRMQVAPPRVWDFQPPLATLRELGRGVMGAVPLLAFSLITLAVTWLLARLTARVTRRVARRHPLTPFLRDVVARAAALAVFIVGLYIVLRVAGLTTIAVTVLGGTGLLGLVLGIAFRGITENFLASIFLSLQQPFRAGDLVRITDFLGYVQRLTNRATVLMTLDGHHVQIPNTIVYQNAIRNYTSNPNRREDFCVGIGYSDSIAQAQEVALHVLRNHPAVLREPEPWVLVDSLGKATVHLRVYFWLDGSQHSWLKVKSAVIRLIKRAFQDANISMPDEARELIFPEGVPVRMERAERHPRRDGAERRAAPAAPRSSENENAISARAEAGLGSEAADIQRQARQARTPDEGENLLRPCPPP